MEEAELTTVIKKSETNAVCRKCILSTSHFDVQNN